MALQEACVEHVDASSRPDLQRSGSSVSSGPGCAGTPLPRPVRAADWKEEAVEPLVAIVILAGAAAAVGAGIRAARRRAEAQRQRFRLRGFVPCETEAAQLQEIVRRLWDEGEVEVRNAWRRGGQLEPIYWYEVHQAGRPDGPSSASDEFLCRLRRRSAEPFVLYLKPAPMKTGFASRMIENLLAFTACRNLERIELGDDSAATAMLAAFGPRGKVLADLLDDELLQLLAQGARHGFFAIRGHGEHCSLETMGAFASKLGVKVTWEDSCAFAEQVAAWRAKDHSGKERIATLTG
jgi:hypothetical protein